MTKFEKDYLKGEEIFQSLSDNLKMIRKQSGLTQAEMAFIIDCPRTTYSAVESGNRKMTMDQFLYLIDYFYGNDKTQQTLFDLGYDKKVINSIFKANAMIEETYHTIQSNIAAFGGSVAKVDEENSKKVRKALKNIKNK